MRIKPLCVATSALSLALSAAPAPASQPQTNSVAKEKSGETQAKKICRWLPVTGSNYNQKVCLTAEEWKKAESLSW